MSARPIELALIGGTGLYQFPGLEIVERVRPTTPYGDLSGDVILGDFEGHRVAFLARHGESHTIPPHRVNYRANVHALKSLGATRVIGVNAVGGITALMVPRAVVVPHQLIDYTHGRDTSFCDFPGAEVNHIDLSVPYTESLCREIVTAARAAGIPVVEQGVYGATQGPRLETIAEITRMARDGCDIVGMTGMPEAALARELSLEYACIALVANWAAGANEQGVGQTLPPIELPEIFENLKTATAAVPAIIAKLLSA